MENKRIEFILEHELISKISKDNITIYIKQLEKENVELKKHRGTDDTADAMIYASMESQKQEITELKNQLQAKDKALVKAYKTLTEKTYSCPYESYNIEPRGDCRKHCKNGMESKCWKELCENGTD